MSGEILGGVLALAEGMVSWRSKDLRAVFGGSFAMAIHVGHTHHHQVRGVRMYFPFGNHDTSVTEFELDAVVADPKPDRKTECVA